MVPVPSTLQCPVAGGAVPSPEILEVALLERWEGPSEVGLWLGLPKAPGQVGVDNNWTVISGGRRKASRNLSGHTG